MISIIKAGFRWIWDRIDPLLALAISAVFGVLGALNKVDQDILFPAILVTLTIIAFTLIRERDTRNTIKEMMDVLCSKLESSSLDTIFKTETSETTFIESTESELIIIQETGQLFLEKNKSQLVSLLKKGVYVRIVLAASFEITARLIAFRNATLDHEGIIRRCHGFQDQLGYIIREANGFTSKLEVRYTPYLFDITCVIVDPKSSIESKRKGLVRFSGFQIPYQEKLDMVFDCKISPKVYAHYESYFRRLFEAASKIVLITGKPGCGKTTLLKRIIQSVDDKKNLYYVLSPLTKSGETKKEFSVFTSNNKNPRQFAVRNADGKYSVNTVVWEEIVLELDKALGEKKILILDEIGHLQLNVPGFDEFVNKVLADKSSTLFATVTLDDNGYPLLYNIKQHHRSNVLCIESEKDNVRIEDTVLRELQSSLRCRDVLPPNILGL